MNPDAALYTYLARTLGLFGRGGVDLDLLESVPPPPQAGGGGCGLVPALPYAVLSVCDALRHLGADLLSCLYDLRAGAALRTLPCIPMLVMPMILYKFLRRG